MSEDQIQQIETPKSKQVKSIGFATFWIGVFITYFFLVTSFKLWNYVVLIGCSACFFTFMSSTFCPPDFVMTYKKLKNDGIPFFVKILFLTGYLLVFITCGLLLRIGISRFFL